jgi:S1-C subfamily serine protease
MKIEKQHIHITITSLTLFIQIGIIITIIFMAQNIVILKDQLKSDINQTKTELENKISDNQQRNDDKLLELTNNLISTQQNLKDQINELRADASSDFSGIIPEILPAVVSIGTDVAQGSGVIITNDGYIVTNAHVLSGGHYVRALTYENDRWLSADLIGYNLTMDIAVLKINGNYPYLNFENSDNVKIGEKAIAAGNPLGLSFSVSEGIISARDRQGSNELPIYFQVDVPLNPGNSGGPLINKEGKIIGINNFKIQDSENLGFSLESNYVKDTVNQILNQEQIGKIIS